MSPSKPTQALGDVIRRQREINQLSMRQFAAMAGISNPYLSQIERGLREPSKRVVDAIARSLGASVTDLYEEAGIAPEDDADDNDARQAIDRDPHLTARQRRALLEVYDNFRIVNGHSAPGRRP